MKVRFYEGYMGDVNCNICAHVSQTEEAQMLDYLDQAHICLVYGRRVIHQSNQSGYHPMIWPCEECVKSEYTNFIERGLK